MSNLYIRVRTGFYTHRKTAKLRGMLGDDAFWAVPRLWAYAAEHQPDGDLSSYDSRELANLIGCYKHEEALLQALKTVGYVDQDGKIHDWAEHNGYHSMHHKRAKSAAAARWADKKSLPAPSKEDKDRDKDIGDMLQASLEHAESIYAAYPRKMKRPEALRAIQKALKKVPYATLHALTLEYAANISHRETRHIPYPASWFNAEGYNDNDVLKLEHAAHQNGNHKANTPNRNAHVAPPPAGQTPLSNDLGRLL